MNTFLWRNATPEQLNLYNLVIAKLTAPVTITPQYFNGANAASEWATYVAKKIYLTLALIIDYQVAGAALPSVAIYDENNALVDTFTNANGFYTGAAVNYIGNTLILNNLYFGKIVLTGYTNIKFNGYKLVGT
jgi:hypothetical protein